MSLVGGWIARNMSRSANGGILPALGVNTKKKDHFTLPEEKNFIQPFIFKGVIRLAFQKMGPDSQTVRITFNANGGKGSMKTLSATYDKYVKLTDNAFKRTGYKFSGWAKSKSGKVAYKNKAKVKNLTATNGKTVTLYAVWKKAKSSSVKSAAPAAGFGCPGDSSYGPGCCHGQGVRTGCRCFGLYHQALCH